MSSFFCERTAEYALVSVLQRSLASRFGSAIPIFYWKTREGNRVSSDLHKGCAVRILAMFARRPKIIGVNNFVAGKINHELAQFARAARSVGIFTVAGFPAVMSILHLYDDPPIFWLPINSIGAGDIHFFTDLSHSHPEPVDIEGHHVRTMTLGQIQCAIEERSIVMPWDEAMQRIAELRLECCRGSSFFWFGGIGGYKPVYFLMPCDDS